MAKAKSAIDAAVKRAVAAERKRVLKIIANQRNVYVVNAMQPGTTEAYRAQCEFAQVALDMIVGRVRMGGRGER